MKQFVKLFSKNSLLLWWLTILNHLALMIYIYHRIPLDFSTDFSLQMVLLLIIALIVFSYICNIVTFRYSELKLWLLLMMFLISWQSIFNQGVASTLLHFFDILHPLNSFLLVYSSLSIIFLGEKIGEELSTVFWRSFWYSGCWFKNSKAEEDEDWNLERYRLRASISAFKCSSWNA